MVDYSQQLEVLLGDCVDKQLAPRFIYQYECPIDHANPAEALTTAARDIMNEMRQHGCTRVFPCVRAKSRWLDVNCLLA